VRPESDTGVARGVALQALHAGLPVVSWDAAPLNETVTHCHDGLLLPLPLSGDAATRKKEKQRVLAEALTALKYASKKGGEDAPWGSVVRMMGRQRGLLVARQHAWSMHVLHRLLRGPSDVPPTIVSFWPGPHSLHRRTGMLKRLGLFCSLTGLFLGLF